MPVVNKPETSMALLPHPAAPEVNSQPEPTVRQPRQRMSLQGLMRFSMEATRAEDAPQDPHFQPMDEERRKFLEDALKSLTVDVVEVLQKQIEILKKVGQITSEDDNTEYTNAIETILEYVDQIDTANDFHKIGGFMILYPCLKSQHPKIQAGGCELLAVLCQNNIYCQQIVLDNEFVPLLLNLVDKDEDITVSIKALYALGSIVRDNEEGVTQLIHYNGLEVLLNTLKKNNEKMIIKSAFMLATFCRMKPELKTQMLELNYIPTLISRISTEHSQSQEHILSLLICLVEDMDKGAQECCNPKYNLKTTLQKYIATIKDNDSCQEAEEYSKRLLHILNAEQI